MTRTRFAPSPTGYLHIGGLRTALFAYLIAKSQGGKVILRLEDTDQKRLVPDADHKLYEILDWAGLEFDEGPVKGGEHGPYIQSQRKTIYARYAAELLDRGGAYRCFCSPERLERMRAEQAARHRPPRYDRSCRDLAPAEAARRLAAGEKCVLRQAMPLTGEITVKDELRGEIKFRAGELDDHVLLKSDGMPTYQFAIVIDDHLMGITHVSRGEEWIPSLPKNALLYRAFGWDEPKFIHFPLVLNKTGGKLSKRQGDVSVEDFRAKGYLAPALLNFCALLGWHPKGEEEIMGLAELTAQFDYRDLGTSPAVFDTEKLDYLNGHYIRRLPAEELGRLARPFLAAHLDACPDKEKKTDAYITKVAALEQERIRKLSELGELAAFFFAEPDYEPGLLVWKKMDKSAVGPNLKLVHDLLSSVPDGNWTDNSIEEAIMSRLQALKAPVGEYLWPMRVALTGRQASPGPFAVAETLGRETTLKRIEKAIAVSK